MKMVVCSVFDKQVGAYLPPFFARSIGEAMRLVRSAANDGNSQFCKYPADYRVCQLASFDDVSGIFANADGVTVLGEMLSLIDIPDEIFPPGAEMPPRQG